MDNGIYIALSRQLALFRDMAATTNNIANANTTGYQAEKMVFADFMKKDNNLGDRNPMDFANDISTYRYTQDGPRRYTGNQLDVAIEGPGYFMVQTPAGIRYTRAGSFSLNADGVLVTPAGYPVLDAARQSIEFPPETTDVVIGSAGNVKVNGEDFATLGVALFQNSQLLTQGQAGVFNSDIEPTVALEDEVRMTQGTLENSNVQPVIELTHMIDVSRSVSSTAKYIEMIYELQRKTTNTWTQQG